MSFFIEIVNEQLGDKKKPLMIEDEYCLLMSTLSYLHYYKCSPASFFDPKNAKEYPAADRMIPEERFFDIMRALAGDVNYISINQSLRIIVLKQCECVFLFFSIYIFLILYYFCCYLVVSNKTDEGETIWDPPMSFDKNLRRAWQKTQGGV